MSNVRDFGARGDGQTDDTTALTHAVEKSDGRLHFPRGIFRITKPLVVPLDLLGRFTLEGQGATLQMSGAGPAIQLVGTHRRTAQPDHFAQAVWQKERMPALHGLEIQGDHPEADGLLIDGTMQATLEGLLIRRCRHGIRLHNRARNVIIAQCHIYDNTGVGVFLDRVNLHQINITGCHISYCKQGGIKVEASEIRNIQICGNDIEYNFDLKRDTSADVLFDCRAGTVREGTIVGNTIQASKSPGGANVRLIGHADHPNAVGLLAITGNLIGSGMTLLHLVGCRGVVVSGNSLYSGFHHAIHAKRSEQLVITGNSIDHNPEYQGMSTDQVLLQDCRHVNITGLLHQHTRAALLDVAASIEVRGCHDVQFTGCQIVNARKRGIAVQGSSLVRVADCTIRGREEDETFVRPIDVDALSKQVMVVNNFLGKGKDDGLPANIAASGNVTV
jgi:polygalacturonase